MTEYRRGVENKVWQELWHFNPRCDGYPERSFAIRQDKPSDDFLCSRCVALGGGG